MSAKGLLMGTATIGPSAWRNNTMKEIKLSQTVARKSDRACDVGKTQDPLPQLRVVAGDLSNEEAHLYFRQTRAIVSLLRDSMIDTNEEIKSLSRGKEALEKALDHIRKDIKLNRECRENRRSRPAREKEGDGADDLLHAERMHLFGLKRMLESQLQSVQQQLQVLDEARRRLMVTLQERSRVLDLICHALPSGSTFGSQSHRPRGIDRSGRRSRVSMSADGALGRTEESPVTDPMGPYTPEAEQALQESREARSRSAMLRRELADAIVRAEKVKRAAQKSVNDGLTLKVAETVGLRQQLEMASGQNRDAIHRAQRWYNTTEKTWGITRGPVSSSDLTSREKINRPIIQVYQRHPGTSLTEAQEVKRGGSGLLESLQATSQNIGAFKLAQLKLKDDLRDKKAAVDIDGSIVRLRRRKADHRWVMGEAY